MRTYWWTEKNFGDTLTPIVLKHFLPDETIEWVERDESNKLLGIGSIVHLAKSGDTVWGSGSNRGWRKYNGRGVKYLAVRGPLTRSQIFHAEVPEVYGDPALLLPLIYNPEVKQEYEVGLLPHYVDKPFVDRDSGHFIDIQSDWKNVINEVKKCKKIIASSLHGIIVAEAFGVPAVWVKYSEKIIGGEYKYQDYFLGSGRGKQKYGVEIPPILNLKEIQDRLIKALNGR